MVCVLWRGEENREKNLRRARLISSGAQVPLTFGSQFLALENDSPKHLEQTSVQVSKMFSNAGLYDGAGSAADSKLVDCIVGVSTPTKAFTTTSLYDPWDKKVTTTTFYNPWEHKKMPPLPKTALSFGDFCCFAAVDDNNVCGTCLPKAHAPSTNWCSTSSQHCSSCQKTWCHVGSNASVAKDASVVSWVANDVGGVLASYRARTRCPSWITAVSVATITLGGLALLATSRHHFRYRGGAQRAQLLAISSDVQELRDAAGAA